MTAKQASRRAGRQSRPFLQVLAIFWALLFAALLMMTLSLAATLSRAGDLLAELRRSEDQLAQVTQIEAEFHRLRADAAAGDADAARAARAVEAELAAYRKSIATEGAALGPHASAHQAAETRNANELTELFASQRADLMAAHPPPAGANEKSRRFTELVAQIGATERAEARTALAAMQDLRRVMSVLGVTVPLAAVATGVIGAWIMLASLVRPLRTLEAAAGRAGAGERIAPVEVEGYAEFQLLAEAFNRMDEEIAVQRAALADANRGLEAQVQARTREIEDSREKLATLDRTRRLFYSRLSHELRTPVTVMRGEAETALRDRRAPTARLREALDHIAANAGFLQRRLEDMLALSRAEDGRILLEKAPVDLAAIMRRTAALAEPYVRSSGAQLVAEIGDDSRPVVLGDASWLQQGLLAIVDNAAKFSGGEGPVQLRFAVEGRRARIAVTDSGPGVDPADLPFLFDSYYQTAAGRMRGGAGLGLSIARWVVEEHGGTIAAESGPSGGLTVNIELPIAS
jgi:signal transduction histidine kinase